MRLVGNIVPDNIADKKDNSNPEYLRNTKNQLVKKCKFRGEKAQVSTTLFGKHYFVKWSSSMLLLSAGLVNVTEHALYLQFV